MNWDINSLAEEGAQCAVNTVRKSYATLWLPASSWVVLSRIIFLCALHALKKQKLTRSCMPSRRYLGDAAGLHISTISSITTKHVELGFTSKLQRRKINDEWQTNLYKLEGIIWGKVKAVIIKFLNEFNRVAQRRHLVSKGLVKQSLGTKTTDFPINNKSSGDRKWLDSVIERNPDSLLRGEA